jgi:hypothetical protein
MQTLLRDTLSKLSHEPGWSLDDTRLIRHAPVSYETFEFFPEIGIFTYTREFKKASVLVQLNLKYSKTQSAPYEPTAHQAHDFVVQSQNDFLNDFQEVFFSVGIKPVPLKIPSTPKLSPTTPDLIKQRINQVWGTTSNFSRLINLPRTLLESRINRSANHTKFNSWWAFVLELPIDFTQMTLPQLMLVRKPTEDRKLEILETQLKVFEYTSREA